MRSGMASGLADQCNVWGCDMPVWHQLTGEGVAPMQVPQPFEYHTYAGTTPVHQWHLCIDGTTPKPQNPILTEISINKINKRHGRCKRPPNKANYYQAKLTLVSLLCPNAMLRENYNNGKFSLIEEQFTKE